MFNISSGILSKKYRYQILATLCVNIVVFSHGITNGWLAPTLPIFLTEDTPLSSGIVTLEEISWIGSLISIGGFLGNLLFGTLVNKIGRKKTLLVLGIPQMCFWIVVFFGDHVYHLYVARLSAGMTGGGIYTVLPLFLSEIADKNIRGALTSSIILTLNVGILVGFIVSSYLPYHVVPLCTVGFPVLCALTILYFPETPQRLLEEKREIEAENSFKFYRNAACLPKKECQELHEEFANLKFKINGDATTEPDEGLKLKDFWAPKARKGLLIALTLMMLNQASGSYAIINYTSKIYNDLKANIDINTSTISIGIVQILGTLASTVLVERAGRKILLAVSSFGMALGLGGVGIFGYFSQTMDLSQFNWVPAASLSFAVFAACIGLVPLPFVVMTEIVPIKIRPVCATICCVAISVIAFAVMKVYPMLMDLLHLSGLMFATSVICIVGAIFIVVCVPETKGTS